MKQRVHWIYICSGSGWEHPGTSPRAGFILDDVILWIMGHFGSLWRLWHLLRCLLTSAESFWSSAEVKTIRLHVNVPILFQRWVFAAEPLGPWQWPTKDLGMIKSTIQLHWITSYQPVPLSCSTCNCSLWWWAIKWLIVWAINQWQSLFTQGKYRMGNRKVLQSQGYNKYVIINR